jgi:hypothetical protein
MSGADPGTSCKVCLGNLKHNLFHVNILSLMLFIIDNTNNFQTGYKYMHWIQEVKINFSF